MQIYYVLTEGVGASHRFGGQRAACVCRAHILHMDEKQPCLNTIAGEPSVSRVTVEFQAGWSGETGSAGLVCYLASSARPRR
jgi:hypothetical protein